MQLKSYILINVLIYIFDSQNKSLKKNSLISWIPGLLNLNIELKLAFFYNIAGTKIISKCLSMFFYYVNQNLKSLENQLWFTIICPILLSRLKLGHHRFLDYKSFEINYYVH